LDADRAPQLKAIYKASQEKKSVLIQGVPKWFLFLHLTAPSSVFQKRASLCDRTLLTAFVLAFLALLFVFLRLPHSRCPQQGQQPSMRAAERS
jgi:hypothetical protein